MKRSLTKKFEELRLYWKNYVLQSIFATLVIFAVLSVLGLQQAVIIASIGATAFIVFAMPNSAAAKSVNIIGGQLVGFACGYLCAQITTPDASLLVLAMVYSLAVGSSMFIMVVTDTEHPPASGTALGVAISGFSPKVLIALIASVIALSLVHHFFKRYLKDLT
jgi:CBS-domain-containing membrane protein